MDFIQFAQWAMPMLFAGGAAWGGSKVALNGTRERVRKLEQSDDEYRDRLARIETKLDILLEKR